MQVPRQIVLGGVTALVVVALSLCEFVSGPAWAADEAMAVDCDASTPAIDTACTYGAGEVFQIEVHATNAGSGYAGYQVKVLWTDATLDYRPTADPETENQWPPECLSARIDNQPGDPSVLYGCAAFPLLTSIATGPLVRLEMECEEAGMTALTLVPRLSDPQLGTHFADSLGSAIDPALTGAQATCLSTPAITAGDVNKDGRINSIDAALVLQFSAGLVASLAHPDNADANQNGAVNSVDAALILQFSAGLLDALPPAGAGRSTGWALNTRLRAES